MSSNTFPCPKCGHFRGAGGVSCNRCGRDPNAPVERLPVPLDHCGLGLVYRDALFCAMFTPVMMIVGFPVGYIVLKAFSLWKLDLGPWDNDGRPYSFSPFQESHSDSKRMHSIRSETVALVGWNLVFVIAVIVHLAK